LLVLPVYAPSPLSRTFCEPCREIIIVFTKASRFKPPQS